MAPANQESQVESRAVPEILSWVADLCYSTSFIIQPCLFDLICRAADKLLFPSVCHASLATEREGTNYEKGLFNLERGEVIVVGSGNGP